MAPARVWEGNTDLRRLLVPVGELRRHPANPRRGDLDAIRASLRRFGQQRPVLALPDGTIVAGNHTFQATVDEGWSHCAVVRSDLTDAEVDAYLAADNRTGDLGTYDDEVLARLLQPLYETDRLLGTGYDPNLVERLLARASSENGDSDPPDAPTEAVSERGTLYALGDHVLMCGDSSSPDDVSRLVERAGIATLALADPPYNVDYRGGTNHPKQGVVKRERTDAYHDRFDDYAGWLTAVLTNAHQATDDRAALMLWHSPSQMRAILAAIDGARWVDRTLVVWNKGSIQGGIGQASKQYRTQYEPMWHCHKKGKTPRWHGPGNETDVWDVTGPRSNPLHPTMKPVDLYERTIRNHSRKGDRVIEMFGGSGTSLIAAEATGRRAALMEIDPRYCDVIRQRYADYVGDQTFAP